MFFKKHSFKIFLHIYIKVSKTFSAKYYQVNNDRLQNKACERHQMSF